jgi:hypothetical protein
MDLPLDWHTGLNMVQFIFNVMYVGFLDQFQSLLGWKKVNKDVSSCYFQATWLMTFVFDELVCNFYTSMSAKVCQRLQRSWSTTVIMLLQLHLGSLSIWESGRAAQTNELQAVGLLSSSHMTYFLLWGLITLAMQSPLSIAIRRMLWFRRYLIRKNMLRSFFPTRDSVPRLVF